MTEEFQPEKLIWTEEDFDEMKWHDCTIYAIAFQPENFEFILDIDYIYRWETPEPNETHIKFQVAPATLVLRTFTIWKLT